MAMNDYRSYMRATEEYRHSDTLQHAGKKGMKWGISHTPGYKAIGQKAKGIINSLGNYVYNTYNKLTSKSTPTATLGAATAAKVATKDPAKEARDEAFNERSERPKNPAPPKTPESKKEEDKPEPKTESHAEVVGKIDAKEGPKEPQKDDLKEDEHGKYRIVDGEKHYDLGDGKEYLYTDGMFFEVGGTGKTVPEGKTPEPAKPGEREPSDRMVDDDGNLKLLDQYGPYFDVNGEKHYDIEGKDYYYSDGLYFPVDGSGEALALVWNDEKFCFEPAEDVRHSETSPRYIGEILNEEDADWTKLRNYIEMHSEEVRQMDSDQNELYHEGRGHLDGGRSGRYPWGSGADPYQRSELGSARAAAEGILNRAGNMSADKFLNNGILDVSTVANNAVDNGRPLTSTNKKVKVATTAAYSLAKEPTLEKAAEVVPKAILDSGTRGWTEHDFDGIPTEIIKQSNERSAAIKAYKGFHGESTPVNDGAAKAAKVASLGLTAIAFIKLVEGLKGKGGSP